MLFAFPTVVYANALQCARMTSADEFEAGVLGLAVQGQVFSMCSVLGTPLGAAWQPVCQVNAEDSELSLAVTTDVQALFLLQQSTCNRSDMQHSNRKRQAEGVVRHARISQRSSQQHCFSTGGCRHCALQGTLLC